ncbi:MAG: hypothetical protein OXD43_09515 [Bacteroidetes bacterium]|nr:hypothetical protein [Bacteroidota bacterium]
MRKSNSEGVEKFIRKVEKIVASEDSATKEESREYTFRSDYYSDLTSTLAEMEYRIEKIATDLGKIEVISYQDRKELRDFSIEMFEAVKIFDRIIISAKNLPKKVRDKLEYLASRVEDIAETSALSSSEDFHRVIEEEIL